MPRQTSFHLLLASLVLTLGAPLPLRGAEANDPPEGDQADHQAASEDDVARELADLKQAIVQLERKIDRLDEQPSEFSHVEVRVVDQQGRPISGFKVELTSSDAAQLAKASGVSNEEGIALTRHLPYGAYRMSANGNGWHAREVVTVEVGKPLELTVVAPTPNQFGELILKASLSRDALEGLPFGGWKSEHKNGWATSIAPEPQGEQKELVPVEVQEVQEESSKRWETFPTVSDGIEVLAVVVEISIERRTRQPDGSLKAWQWHRASNDEQQPNLRWLVQSDGTLRPLLSAIEKRKKISAKASYFGELAPEDESGTNEIEPLSRKRLGYYDLKLGEEHRGEAIIELPAGQIKLSVDDLYGRPSQDVLQVVDEPAESSAGQLWLPAVVTGDSKWLDRLLDDSMTAEKQRPFMRGFATTVELAPDGSQTVAVGTAR